MDLQKQCDATVQIPDIKPPNPLKQWWVREWHKALVFLGLRPDWQDPDNAPPAFAPVAPHKYLFMPDLQCCAKCGGGRNHAIHQISEGATNAESETPKHAA